MLPDLTEGGTEGNGSTAPTMLGEVSAYVENNLRWRLTGGMDIDADSKDIRR